MHTTKISVEPYLAEYIQAKWGKPHPDDPEKIIVEFPRDVYLYHTLASLTKKQPKNTLEITGNIEVKIPEIKELNKDPEYYNYISREGSVILNKSIRNFFRAELHEYMDRKKHGEHITYKNAAFMFAAEFRIESFDPESILKNYSRWRKKTRATPKTIYVTR